MRHSWWFETCYGLVLYQIRTQFFLVAAISTARTFFLTNFPNHITNFFRFASTYDQEGLVSLDDYLERMNDDQDTIFYLPGDSLDAVVKSPLLKKYEQEGIEVLLMPDPIDEFCMQHLSEYERKKVKSIAKDDANPFDKGANEKKKQQKLKEMYKPLTDWWKKLIGKDMESIKISNKLVDDAAYIFTSQYGYSAQMEKINRAQAFAN